MKRKTGRYLSILCLVSLAVLFLSPVALTLTHSLMQEKFITAGYLAGVSGKVIWVPPVAVLDQYYYLLFFQSEYTAMFLNSAMLSVAVSLGHCVVSVLSAFVLAKMPFRGRGIVLGLYLLALLLPFQVTLLQNFMLAKWLHIYDTWLAIILPGVFAPLGVMLLRQFMLSVPDDLCEYVYLESSGSLKVLWHAVLPWVKSGVIALMMLTFCENWNMVDQPLILLADERKYPLSVAFNSLMSAEPRIAFAGCVIYMLPVFILFSLFKENILNALEVMAYEK